MVTNINCPFSTDNEMALNMFQHSLIRIKIKNIKTAPEVHKGYLKPMRNFIFSDKTPQVFPFQAKTKKCDNMFNTVLEIISKLIRAHRKYNEESIYFRITRDRYLGTISYEKLHRAIKYRKYQNYIGYDLWKNINYSTIKLIRSNSS